VKLAEISIKRPVFIAMQVLAVLVLGVLFYTRIGVDLMPAVNIPYISITTIYPGAGAEEIERNVTKVLEDELSSTEGLDTMFSTSGEGYSSVWLKMKMEADARKAMDDVRTKLDKVISQLPEGIEKPTIDRFDIAALPIMTFSLSGDAPIEEIRQYAEDKIKPQIEKLKDVGGVDIFGGKEREIKVYLDAGRLAQYQVPIQMVIGAIKGENVNIPGGLIKQENGQTVLRTVGEFEYPEEIEDIVVMNRGGTLIRVRDLGYVDPNGFKDIKNITRVNGVPSVTIQVHKQSGANTVEVTDRIKKELTKIEGVLPKEYKLEISDDQSVFIRDAVANTKESLYLGALFAVLVILFFIGDLRSTIISALAIPTSIIFTFVIMYYLGYTLNMVTLMALSLAVGILIDDAIVVRENIWRHMEGGEAPKVAAYEGTKEVAPAVLATTLTIVAVFVPMAFMTGEVGQFFRSFGITVAVAVLYSMWDAFTMAPMLSAHFLVQKGGGTKRRNWFERLFLPFERAILYAGKIYKRILAWSLEHRKTVIFSGVGIFVVSLVLGVVFIGTNFMTSMDRGEFYISVETPEGWTIEQTSEAVAKIEERLSADENVVALYTTVGNAQGNATTALIRVVIIPKGDRDFTVFEYKDRLRQWLDEIPGLETVIMPVGLFSGEENESPVEVRLYGPDQEVLNDLSQEITNKIKTIPGIVDPTTSSQLGAPEYRIVLDRNKVRALGLSSADVAMTVRMMVDGLVTSEFRKEENEVDIRVQVDPAKVDDKDKLEGIILLSPKGDKIPLKAIADIQEVTGPTEIQRENRQRLVYITADFTEGYSLGNITKQVREYVDQFREKLPYGYEVKLTGESEAMADMFKDMGIAMAVAIIFVYIVLAIQYNSFIYPFTIMMALPLSIVGAFLFIFLFNGSLDMMTMIGLILLMGIVNKNSILLIDFVLKYQRQGMERKEAILKAGPNRLRPILMTSAAMIMGMLPIAIGLGAGSEFRKYMSIAVIGGLLTSTFLTLIVVPVFYTLLDDLYLRMTRKRRQRLAGFCEVGEARLRQT